MAAADITAPNRETKDLASRHTPVSKAFHRLLQVFGYYLQSEAVECAALRQLRSHSLRDIDEDPFCALLAQTRNLLLLEDHRAEDTPLRAMAFQLQNILSLEDDGDRSFLFENTIMNADIFTIHGCYPSAADVRHLQDCFFRLFVLMSDLPRFGGASTQAQVGPDIAI
ncbi:MAG: hypothetical protein JJU08_19280 [Rhodobacteraceae bacterium]|nr:hypothetical protein [Paracoccaceae bacterium]